MRTFARLTFESQSASHSFKLLFFPPYGVYRINPLGCFVGIGVGFFVGFCVGRSEGRAVVGTGVGTAVVGRGVGTFEGGAVEVTTTSVEFVMLPVLLGGAGMSSVVVLFASERCVVRDNNMLLSPISVANLAQSTGELLLVAVTSLPDTPRRSKRAAGAEMPNRRWRRAAWVERLRSLSIVMGGGLFGVGWWCDFLKNGESSISRMLFGRLFFCQKRGWNWRCLLHVVCFQKKNRF